MQIRIFRPKSLGYKSGVAFQESEWRVRDKERGFLKNKAQHFVFNCIEDGSVIASATIKYWGGVFQIQSLIVKKQHRGKGIGRKLLEKIIAEAVSNNCHQVYVSTLSANSDSIAMYGKMGFKTMGGVKNTFFRQSLIILTRDL
jgi:predicted GNAT family acetyltransferase